MSRDAERLAIALAEMRDRHDRALELRPPAEGMDVPDYITGYRDALAHVHKALTTWAKGGTA